MFFRKINSANRFIFHLIKAFSELEVTSSKYDKVSQKPIQMILFRSLKRSPVLTLVLFLSLHSILSAQNTISSNQILASAKNESVVLLEDKKLDFLKNTNHKMPISDELEYRTELDEMDFQEQEHTLRWSFTGIKERKAQRNYHQATINLHETEKQLVFEEILFDRYAVLVNYFHQKKEIAVRQQQQLVLEDRLTIMRTLAGQTTDFDIEDLIRAEDDWHESQVDIFELQEQMGWLP